MLVNFTLDAKPETIAFLFIDRFKADTIPAYACIKEEGKGSCQALLMEETWIFLHI